MSRELLLIFTSMFVVLISLAIYWKEWHLIPLTLASLFALAIPLSNDDTNTDGKNRVSCIYLSYIPGLGHFYLGKNKEGFAFLLATLLAISTFFLVIVSPDNDPYYLLALFLMSYMAAVMVAEVRIEKLCNDLSIPKTDNPAEMNIKNRPKAYLAAVIVPYTILMLCSIPSYIFFSNDDYLIYLIPLSIWTIVACSTIVIVKKYHTLK